MLYSYPPEAQASPDLPSFCFPHGVQPTLLERTPSMSSLNDLLYSQNYLNSDASSFIFLLKVSEWKVAVTVIARKKIQQRMETHLAVMFCSMQPLHFAGYVHKCISFGCLHSQKAVHCILCFVLMPLATLHPILICLGTASFCFWQQSVLVALRDCTHPQAPAAIT